MYTDKEDRTKKEKLDRDIYVKERKVGNVQYRVYKNRDIS